jgi:hypothetical protein
MSRKSLDIALFCLFLVVVVGFLSFWAWIALKPAESPWIRMPAGTYQLEGGQVEIQSFHIQKDVLLDRFNTARQVPYQEVLGVCPSGQRPPTSEEWEAALRGSPEGSLPTMARARPNGFVFLGDPEWIQDESGKLGLRGGESPPFILEAADLQTATAAVRCVRP